MLAWRIPNFCNVSSQKTNIIKLTHHDETEKIAHDSQIVKPYESLKLRHGEPKMTGYFATSNFYKWDLSAWNVLLSSMVFLWEFH